MLERADLIVLPGWRDARDDRPTALIGALQAAHGRGARIMSLCSGVFLLAKAGLLQGKTATTHWRYAELLRERYPDTRLRELFGNAMPSITTIGVQALYKPDIKVEIEMVVRIP